jgi:magnesium-transporting ATPase (P-type)
MNNDEADRDLRNEIERKTKSANKFSIFIALFDAIACLVLSLKARTFFGNIMYLGDLVQALLVASTAILAFSALMLVEIKKISREGLHSADPFVRTDAVNRITSEALAVTVLRWSLGASIISMISSILCLIYNNPVATIISLFTFVAQIYYFIFALGFSSFLQFIL